MDPNLRGHHSLPHTADVMIEAWGPDLAACCEEAVAALVETYADAADASIVAERALYVPPAPAGDMVVDLLDEVIFALDVAEGIPIRAGVRAGSDGGLEARLILADPASVEPAGAAPKAISRSGLEVTRGPDMVRCRFLVDV
jgi:SHS2 domain-containing protein